MLLLLSRFSRVQLCATSQTAAHQAPLSLGFSRQEYWSGLPFPSPVRESEVAQSCPTLSDPMNCSPPGSYIHGIFQARVLEWGAIAFSKPNTRDKQIRDEHSGKQSNASSKNSTQCYYMTQRSHSQVHTQNNTNRCSTNTCTHMFVAALFMTVKRQKQPNVHQSINGSNKS